MRVFVALMHVRFRVFPLISIVNTADLLHQSFRRKFSFFVYYYDASKNSENI